VLGDYSRSRRQVADVADQIDDVCRASFQILRSLLSEQRRFGTSAHSTLRHTSGSSLTIGQVMHRAPPPPRTSSLPSNAITARAPSGIPASLSRNAAAFTILNPVFSISRNVASFLEYDS